MQYNSLYPELEEKIRYLIHYDSNPDKKHSLTKFALKYFQQKLAELNTQPVLYLRAMRTLSEEFKNITNNDFVIDSIVSLGHEMVRKDKTGEWSALMLKNALVAENKSIRQIQPSLWNALLDKAFESMLIKDKSGKFLAEVAQQERIPECRNVLYFNAAICLKKYNLPILPKFKNLMGNDTGIVILDVVHRSKECREHMLSMSSEDLAQTLIDFPENRSKIQSWCTDISTEDILKLFSQEENIMGEPTL